MSVYLKGFIHIKYCNHGKYVKFHFKMKWLHPRAGPSSRQNGLIL